MSWDTDRWRAVLDRWISLSKDSVRSQSVPILNEPATEEEVRELEKRVSNRLPPSYRSFLLTTNGVRATVSPPDRQAIDAFLPASRVNTLRRRGDGGPVWLDSRDGLDALFEIRGNVAEWLLDTGEFYGLQLFARSQAPLPTATRAQDAVRLQGVVMCESSHARPAVEALRQRKDQHVRRLADHWLGLLGGSGGSC